jgi:hypothetical protein
LITCEEQTYRCSRDLSDIPFSDLLCNMVTWIWNAFTLLFSGFLTILITGDEAFFGLNYRCL